MPSETGPGGGESPRGMTAEAVQPATGDVRADTQPQPPVPAGQPVPPGPGLVLRWEPMRLGMVPQGRLRLMCPKKSPF